MGLTRAALVLWVQTASPLAPLTVRWRYWLGDVASVDSPARAATAPLPLPGAVGSDDDGAPVWPMP